MVQFRVIIPTYNAEKHLLALLPALRMQNFSPRDMLIVDSSSMDKTVALCREFGAEVIIIPQSTFDHGGTRRMAAEKCRKAPFIVMMTQDAIPTPNAFDRLLQAFQDEKVGMAFGRQQPRVKAAAIERHARMVNYPKDSSYVRQFDDREAYGVKTVFSSNSFAAYRTSALMEVGGFPEESFFGEDQITAGRLLMAGWHLAYVSDAEVIHSHEYGLLDDFRRYFDIGVFHSRNPWLLENFGRAEGEGLKFVKSEFKFLLRHEPNSIPSAFLRTLLKYAGYRLGMLESRLPPKIKSRLSMASYYWLRPVNGADNKS